MAGEFIPNEETRKAMDEVDRGIGLSKEYDNVFELFRDLITPLDESEIKSSLEEIFNEHLDDRVCVVGPTCSGKSYLIKQFPYAADMDDLIFPKMTYFEKRIVSQTPWTREIGELMTDIVKDRIKIEKGVPVFGTVVIPSDFLVYLNINDRLLEERTKKRKTSYQDARNMREFIEEKLKESGIPYEVIGF